MSEVVSDQPAALPAFDVISCPPPAERSAEVATDPRVELLAMAARLSRTRDHRLLIEYLRLRRAVR